MKDPGKVKDKNEDKVMVEDRTPSSTPAVNDSILTNASKVKKTFNTKTNGQQSKISQFFTTDQG